MLRSRCTLVVTNGFAVQACLETNHRASLDSPKTDQTRHIALVDLSRRTPEVAYQATSHIALVESPRRSLAVTYQAIYCEQRQLDRQALTPSLGLSVVCPT